MVTGSVVVPAYDEGDTIRRTLDSLAGQGAEVLVVVDGDDDTDALARDHDAVTRVVEGDDAGAGAARNTGVDHATGDVVLFTDADTVVPPHWVRTHLRHYDRPEVVGVGGPATSIEGDAKNRLLFRLLSDYWYRVSWPLGFVQAPGFNCSYRTAAFREAGGFDETMAFMEDTDLSLRMKGHGAVVYDPETEVATSARREREEGYARLFARYVRGYLDHYVLKRRLDDDYFERLK
jgi:glycosyltransferase involved in cell wall biosynthesis